MATVHEGRTGGLTMGFHGKWEGMLMQPFKPGAGVSQSRWDKAFPDSEKPDIDPDKTDCDDGLTDRMTRAMGGRVQ